MKLNYSYFYSLKGEFEAEGSTRQNIAAEALFAARNGLDLPNWDRLFPAWNVPVVHVNRGFEMDPIFLENFNNDHLCAFIVHIDPEQGYLPKISSQITESGTMISNPIDKMTPDIDYLNNVNYNG